MSAHGHTTPPDAWTGEHETALLVALDGRDLDDHEHRVARWLAGADCATVEVIAGWIDPETQRAPRPTTGLGARPTREPPLTKRRDDLPQTGERGASP